MSKAKSMFTGWSKRKSADKDRAKGYEDEYYQDDEEDYEGNEEEDDFTNDDEFTQDEFVSDQRTDDGRRKGRRKDRFDVAITFDASVVATEIEKTSLLKMFTYLRTEDLFSAFLRRGFIFQAHRIIVSFWSRYEIWWKMNNRNLMRSLKYL